MSETLKQSSPESDSYIPSSVEGLSRVGEYLVADYMLRTWERSCQKYPIDDMRPVAEILDPAMQTLDQTFATEEIMPLTRENLQTQPILW